MPSFCVDPFATKPRPRSRQVIAFTRFATLIVSTCISIPLCFADCEQTSKAAESLSFRNLPASVQKLGEEIRDKKGDEVSTAIAKRFGPPARDVGSGVSIQQWDVESGVLTYSLGLVSFLAKGRKVWLTQTVNKALPTITADTFEKYTLPEPQIRYWIGNLSLRPDSGFKFVDSGESLDHRANQSQNFFMEHPAGRFAVRYAAGCSADTVLERLPEATLVCSLTFFPADGSPEASYDIIAYPSERRLAFSAKKRQLMFLMEKGW